MSDCDHVWEQVEEDPTLEFCSELSCGITRERDIEYCTETLYFATLEQPAEFCENEAAPGEEYCSYHLRGN